MMSTTSVQFIAPGAPFVRVDARPTLTSDLAYPPFLALERSQFPIMVQSAKDAVAEIEDEEQEANSEDIFCTPQRQIKRAFFGACDDHNEVEDEIVAVRMPERPSKRRITGVYDDDHDEDEIITRMLERQVTRRFITFPMSPISAPSAENAQAQSPQQPLEEEYNFFGMITFVDQENSAPAMMMDVDTE